MAPGVDPHNSATTVIIGLVLVALGGWILLKHLWRQCTWTRSTATVVDLVLRAHHWHRVMERCDRHGRVTTVVSAVGVTPKPRGRIPRQVQVLVDPQDERTFVEAFPVGMTVMCSVAILVGSVLVWTEIP